MWKFIGLTLFLFAFSVIVVQAQSEVCPTVVEQALQPIGDLCNPLDRNSACYGATRVESTTFVEPRPANFFAAPGDHAELAQLREIHPQPLDETQGTFGVAVMNIQANVPDSVPGQGIIFLLVGDARLTNEVPQDSEEQTPFQSFYFLPGVGQANCYESEPMLTVQTPGNMTVTITLNGVETEMGPGTLLTITPNVCTIHRGHIVQGDGEDRAVLLANQTVDIRIEPAGRIVVNNLRDISAREYQRGQEIQVALNTLATANDWAEQFVTPPRSFAQEPAASPCTIQHVVADGETLHRIAQRYNTSVLGIAEVNQLSDPRLIYTGQVLCIPNPGSGFESLPEGQ